MDSRSNTGVFFYSIFVLMESYSNSILLPSGLVEQQPKVETLRLGQVFRVGTLTRNGRKFLVKGLLPQLCDSLIHKQLLKKEYDLLCAVDHPGVVRALDILLLDGWGEVILMEYVKGVVLSHFLTNSCAMHVRLDLAGQLAEVLTAIHRSGVSHRDLKPDNIMVTDSTQRIKIIDFGLGDSDAHIFMKQSVGTASYGAPEQKGTGSEASYAADIYSLGRLFETLKLPRRYNRLIHLCKVSDPNRRPSAEQVKSLIKRIESNHSRRPLIWFAMSGFVIAGSGIWLIDRHNIPAEPTAWTAYPAPQPDTVFVDREVAVTETLVAPPGSELLGTTANRHEFDKIYDEAVAKLPAIRQRYDAALPASWPDMESNEDIQQFIEASEQRRLANLELLDTLRKRLEAAGATPREVTQIELALELAISHSKQ